MAGKTFERTYPKSETAVYKAAVRVTAELGFHVIATHPEAGIVSFNTGRSMSSWTGQDLTVTVIGLAEQQSRVVVGGSLNGNSGQLVSWGEKSKLANRFLDALNLVLPPEADPQWALDPFGRYDHRWFDGNTWTNKVASNGEKCLDDPDFECPVGEGWAQDPYGRFPLRFYRANRWTDHVAVDGQTLADGVGFPAPAALHLPPPPPPLT